MRGSGDDWRFLSSTAGTSSGEQWDRLMRCAAGGDRAAAPSSSAAPATAMAVRDGDARAELSMWPVPSDGLSYDQVAASLKRHHQGVCLVGQMRQKVDQLEAELRSAQRAFDQAKGELERTERAEQARIAAAPHRIHEHQYVAHYARGDRGPGWSPDAALYVELATATAAPLPDEAEARGAALGAACLRLAEAGGTLLAP